MCIFTISSCGQKQSLQPAQQMTKQKHFYKGELIKARGQLEFVDYPDNFADLVKKEKVPLKVTVVHLQSEGNKEVPAHPSTLATLRVNKILAVHYLRPEFKALFMGES